MRNDKRSTGFHIGTTFITRIIILLGSFVISVLLARLLGPEGRGIVTALFIVPNIVISLADLGVRQASAYYIGRRIYSTQTILSSNLILWVITSIISIIIVFIYYYLGPIQKYGWILVIIALLYIPINILATYFSGIIQGTLRIQNINLYQLITLIINFISVGLLVWLLNLDIYGAALATLIVATCGLIYYIKIIKKITNIKFKYIKGIPQKLFNRGILFAISLFILQLNYKIDIVFLERMTDSYSVGIYTVGTNLAELIWQLPSAISMVLFAKSANSKTNEEAHNRSAKLLRMTLPLLFVFSVIFALLSSPIVTLLYGEAFSKSAEVINILLPGVLVIVISKILHPDLAARGYPLYALYVFIGPLIINIILNLIWIPIHGIYGAAWASTISYSIGGLAFGVVYAKKEGLKFTDLVILKKEDLKLLIQQLKKIVGKFDK